jgi:hypothetical protein
MLENSDNLLIISTIIREVKLVFFLPQMLDRQFTNR